MENPLYELSLVHVYRLNSTQLNSTGVSRHVLNLKLSSTQLNWQFNNQLS
jgi:hypothetical protein